MVKTNICIKKTIFFIVMIIIVTGGSVVAQNNRQKSKDIQYAYFAGGCFWCIESAYQDREGVIAAVSGFSGGDKANPSYKEVSSGKTKYRETVKITYDASRIDYKTLLNIFWRQINPIDSYGQFADRGFQYTTAIFYNSDEQKQKAQQSKKELEDTKIFDKPITTAIVAFKNFYEAGEYHQDYYEKNSFRYKLYYKGSGRKTYREDLWKSEVNQADNIPTKEELKKL